MDLKTIGFTVLLFVVGGLMLIWSWVKVQERRGIFHPRSLAEERVPSLPEGFRSVTFDGPAGRLSGVLAEGEPTAPVVLYLHGNAGHAYDRIPWLDAVLPPDWNGFVLDYRGYGRSEGTPTEDGVYEDASAAVRFLSANVQHNGLIIHGRSLGVPVAAHLFREACPDGVIFESGFPSGAAMARRILPLPGISYLLSVRFDTVEYARDAETSCGPRPKLVIHGERDRVVPVSMGRTLARQLSDPVETWFVPGAGHNDLLQVRKEAYTERVQEFYRTTVDR